MSQLIKLKRSAVPGNVPSAGQLEAGELAINTADGQVYLKKDDNSVVAIGVAALFGVPNGLATLDATGVLETAQIPLLAITETTVYANQAALESDLDEGGILQSGDVAVLTAENETWIHNGGSAGTMADMTQMVGNYVASVNGDAGPAVTLDADDIADGATYAIVTLAQETSWDAHVATVTGNPHALDADDIPDGATKAIVLQSQETAWDNHVAGDGSDHADVATNTIHSTGDGLDHVALEEKFRPLVLSEDLAAGTPIRILGSGEIGDVIFDQVATRFEDSTGWSSVFEDFRFGTLKHVVDAFNGYAVFVASQDVTKDLEYRVAELNPETATLDWIGGGGDSLLDGWDPSICFNEQYPDQVLMVWSVSGDTYAASGIIDFQTGLIAWGSSEVVYSEPGTTVGGNILKYHAGQDAFVLYWMTQEAGSDHGNIAVVAQAEGGALTVGNRIETTNESTGGMQILSSIGDLTYGSLATGSNNEVVATEYWNNVSGDGWYICATLSGTTLTKQDTNALGYPGVFNMQVAYHPIRDRFVLWAGNKGDNDHYVISFNFNGGSPTGILNTSTADFTYTVKALDFTWVPDDDKIWLTTSNGFNIQYFGVSIAAGGAPSIAGRTTFYSNPLQPGTNNGALSVSYDESVNAFAIATLDSGVQEWGHMYQRPITLSFPDQFGGILQETGLAAETKDVAVSGNSISRVHSGLTPGEYYYIQDNGTLDTIESDTGAGKAISSTELVLTSSGSTSEVDHNRLDLLQGGDGADQMYHLNQADHDNLTDDHPTISPANIVSQVSKDPTGFANVADDADCTLSFDDGTKVFTVTHVQDFDVWSLGYKFTKTGNETVDLSSLIAANGHGEYFVYYNSSGVLVADDLPWSSDAGHIFLAVVYWDDTNNKGIIGEERHGAAMSYATHSYLHRSVGGRFNRGFNLSHPTFGGDDGSFNLTAGQYSDEDILHTFGVETTCSIFYRIDVQGHFTWDASSGVAYKTISDLLVYDNDGANAQLAEGEYVNYWLVASNSIAPGYRIWSIMGQAKYADLASAQAETFGDLIISDLPTNELVPLYRLTYRQGTATNFTLEGAADVRTTSTLPSGAYVAPDHGAQAGLGDNDHPQYVLHSQLNPMLVWNTLVKDSAYTMLAGVGGRRGSWRYCNDRSFYCRSSCISNYRRQGKGHRCGRKLRNGFHYHRQKWREHKRNYRRSRSRHRRSSSRAHIRQCDIRMDLHTLRLTEKQHGS
jgi:hypothetical protein